MGRVRDGGHVLVVRQDNDGDVLLAGPAVRAVAARAGRVTLLAGPRGRQAAAALPGVDHVEVLAAPWIDPEPAPVTAAGMEAAVSRLAALAPDAAIILTSYHQSPLPLALLLRVAGVPWIGAISDDYPGSLLDLRHRVPDDVHEVERALSLVTAAGFPPAPGDTALRVRRGGGAPAGLPPGYVVVHPGASVPARAWPATHHAALVEAVTGAGVPVVVTGGPGETALTARVAAAGASGRVMDLGGLTDFAGLAEVLAGARAVVVGNTGPAHLAAAVGTPVVWLHAPTVPEVRWHPWRVPYVRLANDTPCAGCRARMCPVPAHPCLSAVPPAAAAEALGRLAGVPVPAEVACAS
ncbi:MAG TPA: glycosyltransferase family 9 protein [Miltoncostaeaceae bacterium]|nr:glycosyltransferase family 9 protein [Miltoncostaeaceae bacterium]